MNCQDSECKVQVYGTLHKTIVTTQYKNKHEVSKNKNKNTSVVTQVNEEIPHIKMINFGYHFLLERLYSK